MTAGFHAPLPPARTGVADYAADLLAAMSALGDVRANAPDAARHLYHVGNNHLHRDIYARALERPGVVLLHDAVLHHFFLGSLGEQSYVDEFVYNYGGWSGDLARRLWRRRARSAADPLYFEYPMLRRVAESARAVVVHNPAAAAMVRRHAPAAPVEEIPHLFRMPALPGAGEIERCRERFGAGPLTLVVGVLGHLRESKRLATVLRVWERLRERGADTLLVLAGEFASSDLERALRPGFGRPAIVRRGYQAEREFWLTACALDCVVNLRFPAAGETSGIAIRAMGIGKPVILTAGAETSAFPAGTCLRVEAGAAEEEMLEHYLGWLLAYPGQGREIGERAREHVLREHAPENCARRFWEVLRR